MKAAWIGCRSGPSAMPEAVSIVPTSQATAKGQAAEARLAVDEHSAHAAGALAAAVFRRSRGPRRRVVSRLSAGSTNAARSDPLSRNWTGSLAIVPSQDSRGEQPAEMDRQHLASVPLAGDRVRGGPCALPGRLPRGPIAAASRGRPSRARSTPWPGPASAPWPRRPPAPRRPALPTSGGGRRSRGPRSFGRTRLTLQKRRAAGLAGRSNRTAATSPCPL